MPRLLSPLWTIHPLVRLVLDLAWFSIGETCHMSELLHFFHTPTPSFRRNGIDLVVEDLVLFRYSLKSGFRLEVALLQPIWFLA